MKNTQSVAVFDFDYTILNGNAGNTFLKCLLNKKPIRKIVTITIIPIMRLLSQFHATQAVGRSIPTWIATSGFSESELLKTVEDFPKIVKLFTDAVSEIQKYQQKGIQILIISASPEIIVNSILDRYLKNRDGITIIASQTKKVFGGYIISKFCKGKNKVKMAEAAGMADNWEFGYSDDHTDIPILACCRKRFIVNPKKSTIRKIDATFSDYKILNWI